jgi:hypothetical protein
MEILSCFAEARRHGLQVAGCNWFLHTYTIEVLF